MSNTWRNLVVCAILGPPLAWRSEKRVAELAAIRTGRHLEHLPSLSIIVPARNEARNLNRLLPSLTSLSYPGDHEVIVVDDNSDDATAYIAERHNAHVVRLSGIPEGWLGKTNACHQGAQIARYDWLLFTDADTLHAPDGPATAVGYALDNQLDGLSLFLRQQTRGLLDTITLMTAFAALFAGLEAQTPILNGQYILLKRDVYEASGGFAAVSGEKLEDVALGHHLRALGYQVPTLWGEDIAQVYMYEDFRAMWHGLTRLGSGSLRWTGPRAMMTVLLVTAVMSPVIALLGFLARGLSGRWLVGTYAAATASMLSWSARFGSRRWALLAPVGALIVQLAGLWGLTGRLVGRRIIWKGRPV